MRDTALFPVTAYSQRLESSRKHTETEREERGEGWETDMLREKKEVKKKQMGRKSQEGFRR